MWLTMILYQSPMGKVRSYGESLEFSLKEYQSPMGKVRCFPISKNDPDLMYQSPMGKVSTIKANWKKLSPKKYQSPMGKVRIKMANINGDDCINPLWFVCERSRWEMKRTKRTAERSTTKSKNSVAKF